MKPDLGIKEKDLTEINDLLNHVLADGNVLYIKLRKFHWNLSGDNFMELHQLFEDQYDAIAEAIDEVVSISKKTKTNIFLISKHTLNINFFQII